MDTAISKRVQVIGWFLFIFCVLGCIWIVVATIITSQNTGILQIRSANPKAGLIISQNNRQALLVGTGTARVRLKPGSYQISATYGGKQANGVATVYKDRTTGSYLGVLQPVRLPSVATINFEGTGSLINDGLTIEQVNNLEQEFFQYKPRAQTVNISSVEPAPHNPNVDTSFSLNFTVSIDSTTYNATVTYTDLETVQLHLYNLQNNALLFNSAAVTTPGGD
jgi:hypothetical protein